MIDEMSRILADGAPQVDPANGVVVAIIVALGTVLGASIPVIISTRSRLHRRHPLNSDNDDEDDEDQDDEVVWLRQRVRALETWLWLRRADPNRIRTGEEPDDAVYF